MISRKQREIQSLFFAQENTVQGKDAGIPCSQVLQLCACLMQHALNRRVHRRTRAHVQQLIKPAGLFIDSTLKSSCIKPSIGEQHSDNTQQTCEEIFAEDSLKFQTSF